MPVLRVLSFTAAFLVLGLLGCHGSRLTSTPTAAAPATLPNTAPAPMAAPVAVQPAPVQPVVSPAVQAQLTRGRMLYAQSCTACHGSAGEGSSRGPAVIGEGTLPLNPPAGARLRRGQFESAMDLGMFIKDNMPMGGTHLPPSDVACVLAWLLQQHDRTPTAPISPVTARSITR